MLSVPMECDLCGVFKGHMATCPTRLKTEDQRVAYVAWRPNVRLDAAQQLGISAIEYVTGRELGRTLESEIQRLRDRFGDSSYGTVRVKRPIQERVLAMMEEPPAGPICPACENGDHDVRAAADHQVFKCACACNQKTNKEATV